MKLSIVSTLYRSAPGLAEFHRRCIAAAETLFDDIEMILVEDGSPDDSLDVALALQAGDPRIVVAELARNFGHHKAMMTGLQLATGDLVFLLDSDLEEPPEILEEFHAKLVSEGWDVVFGVQRARRGSAFERVTGQLFYRAIEALSDRRLPQNLLTARLMRRDYVNALVAHQDRSFQMSDLWVLTGFRQAPLAVEKLALSPTTYSLARRIRMAVDHVTTTSTRLLYLIFYIGIVLSTFAVAVTLVLLLRYLTHGVAMSGWTSIFLSVWFFGGLIVLVLGILGIYVAALLEESKRRPYTHLRQLHRTVEAEVTLHARAEAEDIAR